MKRSKISRRSFLLGLGAASAAAVLTACGGSSSASTATAASGSAASGSSVVYRTLDQIKESGTINIGVFSALYFALVADLIAKAGKYSSKIGILISYVVFANIDTDTS